MIRTLLVDDEQPARERLRQLLSAHPDVEIVGEAEDGVQAVERIAERRAGRRPARHPDARRSGLDVAASLGQPRPFVIFCTAFDQYAVDAFELSAIDYLLKPVNRARLAAALERVRQKPSVRDQRTRARSSRREREGLTPTRFLARRGTRFRVVPRADVVAFTFDDGVTHLLTATEQLSMQPTLAALARRLDERTLLPGLANRDRAVSMRVREAQTVSGRHRRRSLLANGQTVPVARRRWSPDGAARTRA